MNILLYTPEKSVETNISAHHSSGTAAENFNGNRAVRTDAESKVFKDNIASHSNGSDCAVRHSDVRHSVPRHSVINAGSVNHSATAPNASDQEMARYNPNVKGNFTGKSYTISTSRKTTGPAQMGGARTGEEYTPPLLLGNKDLPGPMSLHLLSYLGALRKLDSSSAYLSGYAHTLYGRGSITDNICPYGTVACALTAAWVWVGGEFPDTIDVISASHYRAPVHGRKIRAFNRKAPTHHVTHVGNLHLTTPARTACDVALLNDFELTMQYKKGIMLSLMEKYHVRTGECLAILEENPFWHNAPLARQFFQIMEHSYCPL